MRIFSGGLRTICTLGMALMSLAIASPGQEFSVILLGTGAPEPVIERFGPSTLVNAGGHKLLFDSGRGATQRLWQLGVALPEVKAVFLTHLHSDHIVGIPDLWLTGWLRGRRDAFRVWGPQGTKEMMSHLERAYAFDIHIRRDEDTKLPGSGVAVEAKDIGEGVVYEAGGVKVTAFLVDHADIKPAYGYRVDFGGRSVVISGDTRYSENLVRHAKGTDVLVHEVIDAALFRARMRNLTAEQIDSIVGHHTTVEDAGRVFAQVKPKLAVYSHVIPWNTKDLLSLTRKTYSGPVEVGADLMKIDIGEEVRVTPWQEKVR
jgi:ribonuclease Z